MFQLLEAVEGVERVDEVLFFEYDLRNHERIGFGKELVKLDRDSLFLSANHQVWWCDARCGATGSVDQLPVAMVGGRRSWCGSCRIFQDVADTVLHQVDTLPHMFDPTVAPDAMVRALGQWIGIDWIDPSLPDDAAAPHRARVLVAAAVAGHGAVACASCSS